MLKNVPGRAYLFGNTEIKESCAPTVTNSASY